MELRQVLGAACVLHCPDEIRFGKVIGGKSMSGGNFIEVREKQMIRAE